LLMDALPLKYGLKYAWSLKLNPPDEPPQLVVDEREVDDLHRPGIRVVPELHLPIVARRSVECPAIDAHDLDGVSDAIEERDEEPVAGVPEERAEPALKASQSAFRVHCGQVLDLNLVEPVGRRRLLERRDAVLVLSPIE